MTNYVCKASSSAGRRSLPGFPCLENYSGKGRFFELVQSKIDCSRMVWIQYLEPVYRAQSLLFWVVRDCGTHSVTQKYSDLLMTSFQSINVAVLMGRHAQRMRISFNDLFCGCWSAEEEKTVIHFLLHCQYLAYLGYLTPQSLSAWHWYQGNSLCYKIFGLCSSVG